MTCMKLLLLFAVILAFRVGAVEAKEKVLEDGTNETAVVLWSIAHIQKADEMLCRIAYEETRDGSDPDTYSEDNYGGIWAAVLLVLFTAPQAIPVSTDITARAQFWRENYNSTGSVDEFIGTTNELKGTSLSLIAQAAMRVACEGWAFTEPINIGTQINNRLPPCPCTADRARAPKSGFREERLSSSIKEIDKVQGYFETTIIDDTYRNFFHPETASCYRQRVTNPSQTGRSGQQCCYDTSGDIIVGPPGGGTVDLVSPGVSFVGHFISDVVPFLLCCKSGSFSNCERYYQYRPSDDCSRSEPQ